MSRTIRSLFRMRGPKSGKHASWNSSSRRFIAALAVLCTGALLSNAVRAQDSSQTGAAGTKVSNTLSPEIRHARSAEASRARCAEVCGFFGCAGCDTSDFNSEKVLEPAPSVRDRGAICSRPQRALARQFHYPTSDRLLLRLIKVWLGPFNC